MKIVSPEWSFEHIDSGYRILKRLERAGRTCYKSEDKITEASAIEFVQMLLARGHESVLEHGKVTVRVICDRGVTHEIVRHRIASYSQESTRYCNYSVDGIAVIDPFFFKKDEHTKDEVSPDGETLIPVNRYFVWAMVMRVCEWGYLLLLKMGATPQEARSVLPNSLKTEIVITYNLREWRHFFKLRTSPAAHPQMREITIPMLDEFKKLIPAVFDDITPEA